MLSGKRGETVVGMGGAIAPVFSVCLTKATVTDAVAEIHYYDRNGVQYNIDTAAPVDGTLRGLLNLYGLPSAAELVGSDVDEPMTDLAQMHFDRVRHAAGVVIIGKTAPILFGFGGNDDRNSSYIEPNATTCGILHVGEAIVVGMVPESVRRSIMDRNARKPFVTGSAPASVAVSNTVLKIFGGASWTNDTATIHNDKDRYIIVTNCEALGGLYAYVGIVDAGTARAGAVSSTDFYRAIPPLESVPIFVPAGKELVIVRGSSATTKCAAEELIVA